MGSDVRAWLLTCLVIPFFCLPLDVLFITLCIRLGFSHLLVFRVSHCICSQPLDPIRIHLLCCMHGGKRMASHDVVQNVFATIARDVGFHVSQEQNPSTPRPTIFAPLNQHCAFNQWCLHIGRCYHHHPHLN